MADSALLKKLRPASFRGVPFEIEQADFSVGRRNEVHEYPQQDKPWVEDLGRATRELSFDAFVVGADYQDRAQRLMAALEEPGPGTLVHPVHGTLTVSVRELARASFRSAGEVRFSLSFVESGELTFPGASNSTQGQSRIAAQDIEDAAMDDFAEEFNVDGLQDFVASDALAGITAALGVLSGGMPGLGNVGYGARLPGVLGGLGGLLYSPRDLARSIIGFIGLSGVLQDLFPNLGNTAYAAIIQSLLRVVAQGTVRPPAAPTIYTPSRQQAYANAAAINALVRQGVLAQAVGLSSLMPATVHDDTVAVRNALSAALDNEALLANDGTYRALTTARGNVWQDLTQRARDSARLTTIVPPSTTPSLVLAYDIYEDAARDTDIVARNRVRHPGFVPAQPLKVLTR